MHSRLPCNGCFYEHQCPPFKIEFCEHCICLASLFSSSTMGFRRHHIPNSFARRHSARDDVVDLIQRAWPVRRCQFAKHRVHFTVQYCAERVLSTRLAERNRKSVASQSSSHPGWSSLWSCQRSQPCRQDKPSRHCLEAHTR
jgi:hypothetical protein